MKDRAFFSTHPVFSYDEFADFASANASSNVNTRWATLRRHVNAGRIIRIRRGLYATVFPGRAPETTQPDPYLVASRLAPDAVLAYHAALQLHGRAYSAFNTFTYLTKQVSRPLSSQGNHYRAIPYPKALLERAQEGFAVDTVDISGLDVRVTSLERTLVDALDRPKLSGGWEEVWRSLESVEYFHIGKVLEYALLLGNATTIGKVGFYLEQHAEALQLETGQLELLRSAAPRRRHYLDRLNRQGRLVGSWNLIVPLDILNRSWEEPA